MLSKDPPIIIAVGVIITTGIALYINKLRNEHRNLIKYTAPTLQLETHVASEAPLTTKKTVLITGGNGFLGSYIVNMLLDQGDVNIIVFDVTLPRTYNPRISYVKGNLLNKAHIEAALDLFTGHNIKVDSVIHSASLIPFLEVPQKAVQLVNVQGTENILSISRAKGVSSFIYTSSATVVLERSNRDARNLTESEPYPREHLDTYTTTKAAAERLVLAANSTSFATCSLRPAAIFGKGDKLLVDKIVRGEDAVVLGTGDFKFDYVPVECVAHAHVLVLKALRTPAGQAKVSGQVYFIGNGEEKEYGWFNGLGTRGATEKLSHWEQPLPKSLPLGLVHALCFINDGFFRLSGVVLLSGALTFSLVDYTQRTYTFSHAKATQDFGYVPLYSVEDKIKTLVQEHRNNAK